MDDSDSEVIHIEGQQRFNISIEGSNAYLDYKKIGEKTLNLVRTYVPHDIRTSGIGSRLADFALQYAMQHRYKIIASCPFIASYIRKNPKYENLIL